MKPMQIFVEELKKEGLELAEESAKMAAHAFLNSVEKMIVASENKYDDLLLPLVGIAKPELMKLIDEINKADNE